MSVVSIHSVSEVLCGLAFQVETQLVFELPLELFLTKQRPPAPLEPVQHGQILLLDRSRKTRLRASCRHSTGEAIYYRTYRLSIGRCDFLSCRSVAKYGNAFAYNGV